MVPVPKNGTPKDISLTPITIMVINTIGLKKSRILLEVLLDPGSTKMLIHHKVLPKSASIIPLQHERSKHFNRYNKNQRIGPFTRSIIA